MSDNKKYYYLRLKENFYDSDSMIVLESMQDGYLYSNILLKLYLRSLKNEGKLMFNEKIPYNSTMLANITRHQVGTIEKAVKVFEDLGLIEILDNGAIYISEIQDFIGKTTTEADRKRVYRKQIDDAKLALNGQMSDKSLDKSPPELELELDLDLEKNIKREIKKDNDHLNDFINKIWELYPNNIGKGKMEKSASKKKELFKIGFEHLERAINRYKESSTVKSGFVKNGSTFFGTDYIDYLDENYVKEKPKPINKQTKGYESNCDERECTEGMYDKYIYKVPE